MGCSACLGNTLKGLLLPFSDPPNTHQLRAVQHRSFSFCIESLISVFNALLASTGYEVRLTVFLGISSVCPSLLGAGTFVWVGCQLGLCPCVFSVTCCSRAVLCGGVTGTELAERGRGVWLRCCFCFELGTRNPHTSVSWVHACFSLCCLFFLFGFITMLSLLLLPPYLVCVYFPFFLLILTHVLETK